MAASVSTRVVSWKEAADRKLSVASDALVIPSSTRLADGGLTAVFDDLVVLALELEDIDQAAGQHVGIAGFLDAHLAQHLTDDDLDVLIADVNALHTVSRLHFLA